MSTTPPSRPGLDQVSALARGLKPIARFLAIASLVAGAWLGYAMQSTWDLTMPWTVTAGLLVTLPGLLFAWLWWLLYALGDLPNRVHGAVETVKEIRDRAPATTGFRKLGRALRDVWNVLDEVDNVWLPISATILLINPIGWIVLAVGFVCAVVLWLAALIVGAAFLI